MTPIYVNINFCGLNLHIVDIETIYPCSIDIIDENTFRYIALPGYVDLTEHLVVTAIDNNGMEYTYTVHMYVGECDGSGKNNFNELQMPELMTPDTDTNGFNLDELNGLDIQDAQIAVYNVNGQLVYQNTAFNINNFNRIAFLNEMNLPNGIYVYQMLMNTREQGTIQRTGYLPIIK